MLSTDDNDPPAGDICGAAWSADHNLEVYKFEDVYVNHEALIFKRGCIYPESFMARMFEIRQRRLSPPGWFLVKNYWLRRGSIGVPSGLWVIDNFSPDNYHHWMVDVLPRLLLAEQIYPDERVLLLPRYYSRQSYIPFTLGAFPQVEKVGWIGDAAKARIGQLGFVPRPAAYHRELIQEIARRVADVAGEPGEKRRIYFTRADAGRRRVKNERDLIRVLREYDFEVMQIDAAEPWEQVRASRGADVIAGVHGAALTNVIFMRAGGRLLELRHGQDRVFVRAYRALAEVTGVHYHAQVCEVAEHLEGYAINDADLIVDIDDLRANLDHVTSS
jgi:capsular polysaccharide biosynthesis protein